MDGGKGNQKNFTPLSKENIKVHVALNRMTMYEQKVYHGQIKYRHSHLKLML